MKIFSALFLFLLAIVACNSTSVSSTGPADSSTTEAVKPNFSLVAEYPHNNTNFTEGYEFKDSVIYESTGLYGQSKLVKNKLENGKELQAINLDKKYFGEGLTVLNNKLYQLTYKEEKCLVYDAVSLKKLGEFNYKGEGWGMTNNGTQIIMSNGSNNLYYKSTSNFTDENIVSIFDETGNPLNNINELEYVDGFIYANIWLTNYIVKIDPKQQKVIARYDFTTVIKQKMQGLGEDAVMNGIAYNAAKKNFYVTGKNWPLAFEIKLN